MFINKTQQRNERKAASSFFRRKAFSESITTKKALLLLLELLRFIIPFLICSPAEVEKILGKNQIGFRKHRPTAFQILTIRQIRNSTDTATA